jgi:hypothetical protein
MSQHTSRRAISIALLLVASIFFQTFPLMGTGVAFAQKPKPAKAPVKPTKPASGPNVVLVPNIVATKVDAWDDTATPDGKAEPGQTITYTVTISNTGTADATGVTFTDTIDPNTTFVGVGSITTTPNAANDSYNVLGNVRIQVPDGASDLLGNDCDPSTSGCTNTGLMITTLAGDNSAPFSGNSTQGGQVTATTGDGSFTYNPPPGFEGSDSFTYTVTDSEGKTDTATVNITISGMIWFVNNNASCPCDGRLTNPFNTLAAFNALNNGAGNNPAANDSIFLYESATDYVGPVTLLNGQKFIGQDATASLSTITGLTPPTHSDPLPATNSGNGVIVNITSAATGITVASGNTLRGFTVGNTGTASGNYDIANTTTATVGTLNISDVSLNGTGGLFRADSGGALAVTFNSASTTSAGSDGIVLGSTSGSVTVNGSGTISGVTGTDVAVNAGTVSLTCSSNITHTSSAAMVSVTGGHTTGTITFSGTLSATNGTGLQFNNADSITSYNFNGTTTLNGGDAGIDITGGSGGTFNFSSNTSITNPSGIAYNEDTSTANVTYNGTITKNNNANNAVNINAKTGGTTAFNRAAGSQITASTTTANAIDLTNTGGTVTFTGGLSLTTTSGVGFNASGSGAIINATQDNSTIVNTISTTTGAALNVASTTIGASGLTFRSISANGAANGIVLNSTGATAGLTVTGNGGTCTSAGTCTGGAIQNTTGAGISLTTTQNVSLTNMLIKDTGGTGILGTTITAGLTVAGCRVEGAGDAAGEHGIFITNLLGTSSVTGSTFIDSAESHLKVRNTTSTVAAPAATQDILTLSNSSFTFNGGAFVGDNIQYATETTANARFIVNNTGGGVTISGAVGIAGVQCNASSGSRLDVQISGVTRSGGTGTGINMNPVGAGTFLTYHINNNNISNTNTIPINATVIASGATTANPAKTEGTIDNNTISNSPNASGIVVIAEGNAQVNSVIGTVAITNNNISGIGNGSGIRAQARVGGTLNLTITNNTVNLNDVLNLEGIHIENGSSAVGDNVNNICLNMGGSSVALGNKVTVGVLSGQEDYRLTARNPITASNNFQLQNFVGSGTSATDVTTWVTTTKNNKKADGVSTPTVQVSFLSSGAFSASAGNCTTSAFGPETFSEGIPTVLGAPIRTEAGPTTNSSPPAWIWSEIPVIVLHQPDSGSVDKEKAAKEDASKGESTKDNSSSDNKSDANTKQSSAPVTTTLTRKTISEVRGQRSEVDKAEVRGQRSEVRSHHAKASRALTAPLSGETVGPITIGTLGPGESVTITFQVTVDNPYSGGANVSNQGSISYNESVMPVLTDDPAVGGAADPTLTPINSIDIFAGDGKAPEPPSGNAPLLFTITFSGPATGGEMVNFTTADEPPGPGKAVAGTCGNPGADYQTTSGSVTFAAGEQVKTVPVPICADAVADEPETFLFNLTGATGGTIQDNQAIGTITANTAGTLLISELRTSGPSGSEDEFVEIYNNTDSPHTVAASDASAGYGVFKMGADCNATPVLVGTIPNGTIIPARGHNLIVGQTYSLGLYANGNEALTSDIENDRNVAVFSTADINAISSANRLDAVGFGTNTGGGVCDLLREGNTLPPVSGSTTEHSFFRKECDFVGGVGCSTPGTPKDTNDNAADFKFADTQGTFISGVPQQLGAPGPENDGLASPIKRDPAINLLLLDATVPAANPPNRTRDFTSDPGNNSTFGTLSVRRRVTNQTGANVTRLRYRVVEITTFPSPGGGQADVRARTSVDASVGPVNDAATCTASGTGSPPCTVTVKGTTLEQPPTQPNGGGFNSTLSSGTITLGTPLANGASINVSFLLGVQTTGKFRFLIIVEALP